MRHRTGIVINMILAVLVLVTTIPFTKASGNRALRRRATAEKPLASLRETDALTEDGDYWGRILQDNEPMSVPPTPRPTNRPTETPTPSPTTQPTNKPTVGMEDCSEDGFCNENCSELTPDPDCTDMRGPDPRCTTMSNFENGDEGWTIIGDAQDGMSDPGYSATGGNPGGHIFAVDDVQGGTWFFRAAAKYRGDFSGAYDKTLSFELRQSSTRNQFSNRDVIIFDTSGSLIWYNTDMNPGTDWTLYNIIINDSSGWMLADGTPASESNIRSVLSDINDIWIRGEYRSGSDTGRLDNVVLVSDC